MLNGDWSVVTHGLQITLVGMGLVFLALGLIVLAMIALTHMPWERAQGESSAKNTGEKASPSVEMEERARVAAIAVALVLSEESRRPVPTPITGQRSAWKIQGRLLQLQR